MVVYHKSNDRQVGIVCGRGISRRFPVHRHKSVSLGMVIKGSRLLTIHQATYVIAEGDIFIINSDESHAIDTALNPEHDYIVLSLSPSVILQHCKTNVPIFENIIHSTFLAGYLEQLFNSLIENRGSVPTVNTRILIGEMCRFRKENIPLQAKDNRLEKVRDFLEHMISDNHTLSSLADKATISAFHLSRLFRNYTGMAPHRYLLDSRLRNAREMLEKGQQVNDTAITTGFYDTSHFIRHFTKYYGISPLTYQESIGKIILE